MFVGSSHSYFDVLYSRNTSLTKNIFQLFIFVRICVLLFPSHSFYVLSVGEGGGVLKSKGSMTRVVWLSRQRYITTV